MARRNRIYGERCSKVQSEIIQEEFRSGARKAPPRLQNNSSWGISICVSQSMHILLVR